MHETSGANHLLEMQEHSAKRMGISNQQTIPMLPKIRYWRWILNFNKCGALLTLTAILLLCSLMDSYSWSTEGYLGFLKCHKSDLSSLFYLHLPGFFNKPRVKVSRYWGSDSPMAALRWGHIQCPGAQGINVETEGDGRAFGHFKAWDGRRDETVRDIRKRLCKIMDVMI